MRGKEIEGAAMGGGAGEKNKEKQIDILKRFATDRHWKACQIRKTSLGIFSQPLEERR